MTFTVTAETITEPARDIRQRPLRGCGHPPALLGAQAAGVRAALAVLGFVLCALVPASVADLSAEPAEVSRKP